MNGSTVTIVGNLTRDPELRFLTSGVPVCNIGVAVNYRFQKNGEWEEQTSFVDCVIWREQGENVAESLAKGDRVVIQGRIEQRSWETDDGDKRSKIEVNVDEIGPALRWATATPRKVVPAGASANGSTPTRAYEDEAAPIEEPF